MGLQQRTNTAARTWMHGQLSCQGMVQCQLYIHSCQADSDACRCLQHAAEASLPPHFKQPAERMHHKSLICSSREQLTGQPLNQSLGNKPTC